jgi:predicted nucleic acid-binding protein
MFLEIAKEVKADYLITGDNDLLELGKFENTEILKPSEFLIKFELRPNLSQNAQ